ncbi:MAG: FtsX-like permease family protein [Cyclobacteriaceae bacterium]
MSQDQLPSRFYRLFQWLCKPDLFEELQGDLEEAFDENVETHGLRHARMTYRKEVLKMLRPSVIRFWQTPTFFNHTIMLKNYFKTSMRSLLKNPTSSFINLFGLSAAIGICILVYGFARWTYGMDDFHEHRNEIYLATFMADRDGDLQQNGSSPRPLGRMLTEDFPQIDEMTRIDDKQVIIKSGDNVFHERVRMTDQAFLKMFTFPLKWGDISSLGGVNNIILSEDMSIKYFGDNNPVGESMEVIFGQDISKSFTIGGVGVAFPTPHALHFDFLINIENLTVADPDLNMNDWSSFVAATLIKVNNPEDLHSISYGMDKYKELQNGVDSDWKISSFAFESIVTLDQKSEEIRSQVWWGSNSNYTAINFLIVIASFLMTLACLNYINISIVSASKRLKEIGIRKSIGATREVVLFQFLIENIFVTTIALFLGLLLGVKVVIPWFEAIINFDMGFNIYDWRLWVYLPIVLLFTGLISGVYPALYISKFHVVSILKGVVKFGKRNMLTKVLLGLQLLVASILITSAVMFSQNTNYIAERSWGYDPMNVVYVQFNDATGLNRLEELMLQNKDVISTTTSTQHLGKNIDLEVIGLPDRDFEVQQLAVDAEYFQTLGLRLKEGRFFDRELESDHQTIIVNELLTKKLGLEQPIGEVFNIDDANYEIIGVTEDFHHDSFHEAVRPTILTLANKGDEVFLAIRAREGSVDEVYAQLQKHWAVLQPNEPFSGGYQTDVWGNYFEEISNHAQFWTGIAMIAVLLAGLGLYGLVTLNVSGRLREFSIRKTLGAELLSLIKIVLRQYTLLFAIALIIGAPASYFAVKSMFDIAYTYHVPMNSLGVIIAVGLLISILLLVVAIQVQKVAKEDPVKGLRLE